MKHRRSNHPMVKLAGTVARLPRYLKLAHALAKDSTIPPWRKAALAVGIGYAVLPFDLLPGVIPIAGQLDDLAALLLGIRQALRGCSAEAAQAHVARAGLTEAALDADLVVVRQTGVWLVKQGALLGVRAVTAPFRLLARLNRNSRVQAASPRRAATTRSEGAS